MVSLLLQEGSESILNSIQAWRLKYCSGRCSFPTCTDI